MQRFNIVLDALNQLRLILTNRTPNVRSNEQRIETRENAEHLVGIFGSSQLITQMRSDASLNAICLHIKLRDGKKNFACPTYRCVLRIV